MASGKKRNADEGGSQYRCTLKTIHQVYGKVKESFTRGHRDLMQQTPFRHLFKALEEDTLNVDKRSNDMLDYVISTYDRKGKSFKFGNNNYNPNLMDVKLVFGLEDGVKEVGKIKRQTRSSSALAERLFAEEDRLTAKLVKDAIQEAVVKKDKTSVTDTILLMCALLLQSVFFPNTGVYIPWGFLYYVEDLERMSSYNWSSHVLKVLRKGLDAKWSNPRNVNGCTVFLLYWICEHWDKMSEHAGVAIAADHGSNSTATPGIPRLTKWNLKDLEDVLKEHKLEDIGDREFTKDTLKPTKHENQLIRSLSSLQIKNSRNRARHVVNNDSDFEEHVQLIHGKIRVQKTPHGVKEQQNTKKGDSAEGQNSKGKRQLCDVVNEPENDNERNVEENPDVEANDCTPNEVAGNLMHHVGQWGSTPSFTLLTPTPNPLPASVLSTVRGMQEENEKLKRELEETRSAVQTLEQEASMVPKSEIAQLKKRVVQLENDNQNLKTTLEKLKIERLDLIDKCNTLESEHNDLKMAMDSMTEEKVELELEITDTGGDKKRLSDELGMALSTIERQEEVIRRNECTIEALQKELEDLKDSNLLESVHQVTQQYHSPAPVGQFSIPRRVKDEARIRKEKKMEEFHYEEQKKKQKTEPVNVDEYVVAVGKDAFVQKIAIKEKKESYKCGKHLTDEAYSRLTTINANHGRMGLLWSRDARDSPYVTVESLMQIIRGSFVDASVVDAFFITMKGSDMMDPKDHIFPASSWATLSKHADTKNYKNELCNEIFARLKQGQRIFFPLCCPGKRQLPYHWVLLMYSNAGDVWKMYHSLSLRRSDSDPFLVNCQKIVDYIWQCVHVKEIGNLKKNLKLSRSVEKVQKLPLQDHESSDCALYVMYYMLKITQGQDIPQQNTDVSMQRIKAMIVNSILMDHVHEDQI